MISIIVAAAKNGVIGRKNSLPWRQQADLKYFKQKTIGRTVVMGRKTYQSIADQLGGPLPKRHNIVVTRDRAFSAPGVTVVHSLEEALNDPDEEIFIIGGAEIYQHALPLTDRVYLTEVAVDIPDGDAFFPRLDAQQWREISREQHASDEHNQYDYTFVVYERV